jgi:formylglycine-generating enzyme
LKQVVLDSLVHGLGAVPVRLKFGVGAGVLLLHLAACTCEDQRPSQAQPSAIADASASDAAPSASAALLYLPDAAAPLEVATGVGLRRVSRGGCPDDMVSIAGNFCIDRYEVVLVEVETARRTSPFYHPNTTHTRSQFKVWETERRRMGDEEHRLLPIPTPPEFQFKTDFQVAAQSLPGEIPNGYLNSLVAEEACALAGKRLCSEDEWVTACKGEQGTLFPYGEEYIKGKCNVHTGKHPAKILHGNASIGHLDPRLNQFSYQGHPLLHRTGANPECASRWGGDAVYDMVGNLDEWIADEDGVFLGGFYARNTKQGCEARISAHPRAYFDYSLGVRCCL